MSTPKKKLGGLSKPAQTLQAIRDSRKSTEIQTMPDEPSKLVIDCFTKDGVEHKAYTYWPKKTEGDKLFRAQVECSTYYLDNSKQKIIARGRCSFLPRYQIDGRPMNKDQANLAIIMDLQDLDPDDEEIAHLVKLRTDKLLFGTNSPQHQRSKQEAKKHNTPMKDRAAKDRFGDPYYQLGSFYEPGDDDGDDGVVDRFHQRNRELFHSHRSDMHFRPMSYEAINELVSQTGEDLHQQLEATAAMIVQEAEAKNIPRTKTIRFQILQALNSSPVSLSTLCLSDIIRSDMGNTHAEYLKYLERKDFTKVPSDNLIKVYLTDPLPTHVMHKLQLKLYTLDDREVFLDWCMSNKIEDKSIDIQDFKFYHSVALLISEKLQLGHTDVDWLVINQPIFQRSRYDEARFFDAARDYHTRRLQLDAISTPTLLFSGLTYYQCLSRLTRVIKEMSTSPAARRTANTTEFEGMVTSPASEVEFEEAATSPALPHATGKSQCELPIDQATVTEYVDAQSDITFKHIFDVLTRELQKLDPLDKIAVEAMKSEDPDLQYIRYALESMEINPFGRLEAEINKTSKVTQQSDEAEPSK